MARFALPFPVLPGKTEEDVLGIAGHFEANPTEYAESRRRSGVTGITEIFDSRAVLARR